jgi:chemotaxis protein histidine kinase CheA
MKNKKQQKAMPTKQAQVQVQQGVMQDVTQEVAQNPNPTYTLSVTHLDPGLLEVGDNVRYKLNRHRIDRLKEEILDSGGIRMPIEAEKLAEPVDGKTHRVITGNYRTVAAQELNADGAGLTVPTIIRMVDSIVDRLTLQITENMERENMSLMDIAVAVDKLRKAEVPMVQIRKLFPRSTGKGKLTIEPASNAWVKIVHSFLDFPADIKLRIHEGKIGILAAYELRKKPAEQWRAIVEKIEADRLKSLEADEKEEAKFLAEEKKSAEQEQKEKERAEKEEKIKAAHEDAKRLAAEAEAAAKKAREEAAEAYKEKALAQRAPKEERERLEAEFKSKESAAKQAQQVAEQQHKVLLRAQAIKEASERLAKEREEKAKQAIREAAERAKAKRLNAPLSAGEMQKAAREQDSKPIPLVFAEAKEAIRSLTILSVPNSKYPKTIALGALITQCFAGEITDGQLHVAVARLFGEEPMSKKP